MTLDEARTEAIRYIKLALEIEKRGYRRGISEGSALNGAQHILRPYRAQLMPYWNLTAVIRRRWAVKYHLLNRPCLTNRQRLRAGMMTDTEKSHYESDCRWKRHRERDWDKSHQDNSVRGQELRRLANLTLS